MPETFDWCANANPQAPTQRGGKTAGSGRTWGQHQEATPGEYIVQYAGLAWRWGAGLIDHLLPAFILLQVEYVGPWLFLGFIGYNSIWRQGKTGQSLGKKLCGMRLCYIGPEDEKDGWSYYQYPGVACCAIRYFAHVFDWILFWGFTGRVVFNWAKRTYADSCVSTVVIRDDRVQLFTREEAEADRQLDVKLPVAPAVILRDDREDDAERRAA